MRLTFTWKNIAQVQGDLTALAKRAADPRVVLTQFGVHMLRSIEQTFQAGGRPTPWPPSGRARSTGGKTLIKSARLKNSISAAVTDPRTLRIGTNVRYARVHQLGIDATVAVPQHTRIVRQVFGRRLQAPTTATVRAHSRRMRIPARPFLVVQDADLVVLQELMARHLEGGKP